VRARSIRALALAGVALLLLCAARAEAAIAFVQARGCAVSSGTSQNCAFTSNVGSGNLLVVGVYYESTTITVSSVTDSRSTSYTATPSSPVTNSTQPQRQYVYYGIAPSGGANTVSVTLSASACCFNIVLAEYSGIDASSPLDQHATAQGSGTTLTTASVTTTQADELLVGIGSHWNTSTAFTAGSGYAKRVQNNTSDSMALEDQIVAATGSYNASFTVNLTNTWLMAIATFKAAGGAPPARVPLRRSVY
jgi:hypothetical protein